MGTFLTENPSIEEIEDAASVAVHKQECKAAIVEDFKSNLPKTVARNFLAQPAFTELESKMIDGYTVVRMPNT